MMVQRTPVARPTSAHVRQPDGRRRREAVVNTNGKEIGVVQETRASRTSNPARRWPNRSNPGSVVTGRSRRRGELPARRGLHRRDHGAQIRQSGSDRVHDGTPFGTARVEQLDSFRLHPPGRCRGAYTRPLDGTENVCPHTSTDDDEGKRVVNANGEEIGVVQNVSSGTAHVDLSPGITDTIKSKLGWGDQDEETPLDEDKVETITDDEVRVQQL